MKSAEGKNDSHAIKFAFIIYCYTLEITPYLLTSKIN